MHRYFTEKLSLAARKIQEENSDISHNSLFYVVFPCNSLKSGKRSVFPVALHDARKLLVTRPETLCDYYRWRFD